MSRVLVRALLAWLGLSGQAHAQIVLTLPEALARARDGAGAVAVARARIAEAEAAMQDASPRWRDGPVVEGTVGPRSLDGVIVTELDFSVAQPLEIGGRRQARIDGAQAVIDRQRADVTRAGDEAAHDAGEAFLDAVAAAERLRIVEQAGGVSRQVLAATERRFAAGDVAAIDLNLARIDAARAEAAYRAAQADEAAALGRLRLILRLGEGEPIAVRGTLDPPPLPDLAELEAHLAERRADLAVFAAEIRDAEAQTRLGRSLRTPELGLRFGYEREETDSIFAGGLAIAFPSAARARGALAAGLARTTRVRLEAELAATAARTEVRTAYALLTQRAAVADTFSRDALPGVIDNDDLAQRSYEAGEMSLLDMLLVRRDGLETRLSVVDRRLEMMRSLLELQFAAGVLR